MKYIADTVDFQLEEPTVVTLGKFDGRYDYDSTGDHGTGSVSGAVF